MASNHYIADCAISKTLIIILASAPHTHYFSTGDIPSTSYRLAYKPWLL